MNSGEHTGVVAILFTDIEGSTRLWEELPDRMRPALARHDALARAAVESHRGIVAKMTGDGVYAAFTDALDAVGATLELQQALSDPAATAGVSLRVRCGMHAGLVEHRDNDYFGSAVNRTARIMSAAHGGQVIVSQAVYDLVAKRLPDGVALRDLGSVRLRDLARPERVYQLVHPALRQEFPALRSLEATPNNLPQQITSFIGRDRELVEVKALLANARLLTLLGVGGLGKTRLSLQAAVDVMDNFPDGVWFVELAPIADPRLVAQAVASVLGVKEEAGRPVQEALVKHVADLRCLVILDNCEHLVQASAELAKKLLLAGAHLKILVSSREHLKVIGETTYRVPSLSAPDRHHEVSAEGLMQFEAARLFVERATAAQSTFSVTDQNAPAVAAICHRLDGIPLAIELAAARVRTLAVEKIASRLHDRFRLLTGGDRTALPRQQTLRAMIEWSYDLLSTAEGVLLRRLSVFAGGWTLEAAEVIGAGVDADADCVLDHLGNLVQKSLVEMEADGARYRLLETVRQYASDRLQESGDAEDVHTRHLVFYVELTETAEPELKGPAQAAWVVHLDRERENLLAAHAWCDRIEGGARFGLRLVFAVRLYWLNRGLVGLGYQVTTEALARAGADERSLARCRALFAAGQQAFFMGRYADAQGYLSASVDLARDLGDRARIAAGLQLLGMSCHGQGERSDALRHLEESVALAREWGDRERLPFSLSGLAELHRAAGDLDAAEPLYEEALAHDRERGDRADTAVNILNLAMVSIGRGQDARARTLLDEALGIVAEIGSRQGGQALLDVCSAFAASRREWELAARMHGAAETQLEQTGLRRDPADTAFLTPWMGQTREALGAERFVAAEGGGRALSYEEAMRNAGAWLARGS